MTSVSARRHAAAVAFAAGLCLACTRDQPPASSRDRPPAQFSMARPGADSGAQPAPAPPDTTPPADTIVPAESLGVMIMVVHSGSEGLWVDPIALLRGGAYSEPPIGDIGDAPADSFRARWYGPGLAYRAFGRGGDLGSIWAYEANVPGCAGLDASARWFQAPDTRVAYPLLASNSRRPHGTFDLPPLTRLDTARLLAAARRIVRDTTRTAATLVEDLAVREAFAFGGKGKSPWWAATFEAVGDSGHSVSLLLVASPRDTTLNIGLKVFYEGGEENSITQRLINVADLDGDGVPELVTQQYYYESHNYIIYRLRPGTGWQRVHAGGGGGC